MYYRCVPFPAAFTLASIHRPLSRPMATIDVYQPDSLPDEMEDGRGHANLASPHTEPHMPASRRIRKPGSWVVRRTPCVCITCFLRIQGVIYHINLSQTAHDSLLHGA